MIHIRPERPADYDAIHELIVMAFKGEGHDEADLVRAIRREPNFTPELSLVAVEGERVVGHVLFSPVTVLGESGATPILALGPLAIHPEYQGQGFGSQLVQHGLQSCRRLGHVAVVVVGSSRYYPRFGFVRASSKGLRDGLNAPDKNSMVIELVPGALDGIGGTVTYPPVWDVFALPVIREATQEDYEEICEVLAEVDAFHRDALPHVFRTPDGPARTSEYISGILAREDATLLIAEHGRRVVGVVEVYLREIPDYPLLMPRRYAVIESLAVREGYHRSGIGRALMGKAHQWALDKGVSEVELDVWEFNEEAIRFYEKLGYRTARRRMWRSLE